VIGMGTGKGFERLVFFTDAVTAIAITLLILPLVDLVPEYTSHHGATVGGFIHEYWNQLWSFVLSFVIIARLWIANHETLERVERQSPRLMTLDVAWAFTVVVLPLPTALIAVLDVHDRSAIAFYVGTMTASSLLLAAICWEIYRRPELGATDRQASLVNFYGVASTAGAFVVALIVGVSFPALGLYPLLILLITFPLDWIVKPRLHARAQNLADTPHG
jgi:uncharacterized membrane protein